MLKTLRFKPGDRLLEFGTGWGGLAIEVRPLVPCPYRPHFGYRSHEEWLEMGAMANLPAADKDQCETALRRIQFSSLVPKEPSLVSLTND